MTAHTEPGMNTAALRHRMTELGRLPGWMRNAACAAPTARGLPWTTDEPDVPTVLADLIRETCEGCPVLAKCEAYARSEDVRGGWWAGCDRSQTQELDGEPFAAEPTQWLPIRTDGRVVAEQGALALEIPQPGASLGGAA